MGSLGLEKYALSSEKVFEQHKRCGYSKLNGFRNTMNVRNNAGSFLSVVLLVVNSFIKSYNIASKFV